MQVSTLVSLSVAAMMAALLVQAAWCQEAQQQSVSRQQEERQPAETGPEPYSFSYDSESLGGRSSHSESGDAGGRVQGFYTIMGEDGRERRVDYVADENGYRASITTNEVGTRSESAADAQYEVQLPSQGQLDQAKVSAQEYEYLESSQAAARQGHLKQLAANIQIQQPQQPQARLSAAQWNQQQPQPLQRPQTRQPQQARQQFDGNYSSWSSQAAPNQSSSWARQQTQMPAQEPSNWTESPDESRRRAAALNLELQPQAEAASASENQNGDRFQNQLPQAAATSSAAPAPALVLKAAANENAARTGSKQQYAASSSDAPTSGANYAQVGQSQQAQHAEWQMSSRAALPAARPVNVIQRQLEQQFMQQAQQLTEQDYPRQASFQTSGYAAQQPQRPLEASWSQAGQYGALREQVLRPAVNQQRLEQQEKPGQFQQQQQQQQQQNNIIDEVSGEQVEPLQPLVSVSQQARPEPQQNQAEFRFNNTAVQQQQSPDYSAPISAPATTTMTTTTTTAAPIAYTTSTQAAFAPNTTGLQPTPSGFLAINLENQENTAEVDQNLMQAVDSRLPLSGFTQAFTQTIQQTPSVAQVKGQRVGDFQRVSYSRQPAQEFRPNSIKQIIESQAQQKQQRQQQQQIQEERITTTTPAASTQPEPTPTKAAAFQPEVTREPEPGTTKRVSDQIGMKQQGKFYNQDSAPQAPYIPDQTSDGYSQSAADFPRGSNQTQEEQQLEVATTRRPSYLNQKLQLQQQRVNFSAQEPAGAPYKPSRQSVSTVYVSSSTEGSLLGQQQLQQQQQQQQQQSLNTSSLYQQRPGTTTRRPIVLEPAYQRKQAPQLVTERPAIVGQEKQQVIETTSAPGRLSFVGVDGNTQLQQQRQALRANSGVKGARSKVTLGQRKQFWKPLAVRQQVQQPQEAGTNESGLASVDYANVGSSFQSPGNFGSRIMVGR